MNGHARAHLPYGAAIVLLSALYYALYLTSGFNFSDEGNYAQICYELFLGRDPRELPLGYGILWFKLGEALFHVFGVHYTIVRIIFFASITLTNILIFYSIATASGRGWFAFAATLVPMLVPAFPATSFYGLCIMLNVAAQMRLARRLRQCSNWDAAIAGAALSLSFQIRTDFGYVFAVPLIVLVVLASWTTTKNSGVESRARRIRALALAAGAGFIAAQIPGLLLAVGGGYVSVLVQQYVDYPAKVLDFLVSGVQSIFAGSSPARSGDLSGALLQRPAILSGDSLAFLVYLPLLTIMGFVLFNFLALRRRLAVARLAVDRLGIFARSLVALSAAAALPHYFLYRPDLSHIANFMPGYVVLVAVFAWQLYCHARTRASPWQTTAAVGVAAVLVFNLALYVWSGLRSEATGSIAAIRGRTEVFQAANGVNVRVNTDEKRMLELIRDSIENNSMPGDRIVCVPYCPGLAFMTGRRMLFRDFYVDDATPLHRPDWLARAAALTREARPPVVIVIDWAINGTDISRFERWAAPYITALNELARTKIMHPGITIYLL